MSDNLPGGADNGAELAHSREMVSYLPGDTVGDRLDRGVDGALHDALTEISTLR